MGRTSDARERLIAAGQTLLGQKSYGTVGVADICTAASVPKGSFYYFFPSKQDLALAVIDRHWDEQQAQWSTILAAPTPIAQRIHDLFLATEKVQENALAGTGSVQGCLFGNLSLELSSAEPVARARLQEIFDAQVALLEQALGDQNSHYDPRGAALRDVAEAVVAQMEGRVLFAKLFNDPARVGKHWAVTARTLGLDAAPVA